MDSRLESWSQVISGHMLRDIITEGHTFKCGGIRQVTEINEAD